MNDIIRQMTQETLRALRERHALNPEANSAEIRRAADYIVKKSPFAPYFAALGITRGCQIGRSFSPGKADKFFSTVVRLYYVKWYFTDSLTELNDIESLFKKRTLDSAARVIYTWFVQACSRMRVEVYSSIGVGKEEDWYIGWMKKLIMERISFEGTPAEYFARFSKGHDEAFLIGALEKKIHSYPIIQEYIKCNKEGLINKLIRHGSIRNLMSFFHGFNLTSRTNKKHQQRMPKLEQVDDDRSNIDDISHAEINKMATAFQDNLLKYLGRIEKCELMDEPYTEVLYEAPPIDMTSDVIFTSGSLTSAAIPNEVVNLAKRLARKHGPVTITSEASGLHIYIPDPELLRTDGKKELTSKHLSINAEKYLGIGRYDLAENRTKENKELYQKFRREGKEVPCAISMKTKKHWSVEHLLSMLPLEKRVAGLKDVPRTVTASDPDKHLVYDENGNLVPEWCGTTVPLSELPATHPAVTYMWQRGFDVHSLSSVYEISYCTEALPEDRAFGRYYSRLPDGYKNSPTGRIIIPIYDENNVRRGWQARCIDITDADGNKWLWTDRETWVMTEKDGQVLGVSDTFPKGWKSVHKYMNARGSSRNTLLFGIKQAVAYCKDRPFKDRYCVLVEGPLDVARGGPPCIALLGKSMSPEQADIIRRNFNVVCTVMDRDEAGRQCLQRIKQQLPGISIKELAVPPGKKDLGDCTYEEARALVTQYDPIA